MEAFSDGSQDGGEREESCKEAESGKLAKGEGNGDPLSLEDTGRRLLRIMSTTYYEVTKIMSSITICFNKSCCTFQCEACFNARVSKTVSGTLVGLTT